MGKESPGLDGGEPAGGGVAFVLFGADVPDFRIAGLGVQDDEAADGGVGLHGAAFRQGDADAFGQEPEDVPLETVVGAGGVAGGRFGYADVLGEFSGQAGVQPAGGRLQPGRFLHPSGYLGPAGRSSHLRGGPWPGCHAFLCPAPAAGL